MQYVLMMEGTESVVFSLTDEQAASPVWAEHPTYATLSQAKSVLVATLRSKRDRYNDAIRRVDAVNKNTVRAWEPT